MPGTERPSTADTRDDSARRIEQQAMWRKSVQPVAAESLPGASDTAATMALWCRSAGLPHETGSAGREPDRRHADDNASAAQPVLTGLGGAAGRDHYVGGQIAQAERAVRTQPAVRFDGELFRAVSVRYVDTFSHHSLSDPGRYNAPGQSALYTATSLDAVRAEAGNYAGLDGRAVVRSSFQGDLLDLRATSGINRDALTEGYGDKGRMKSRLTRLTGEDPYIVPRAVADVVRERGLSGVIAPANMSSTHVALFPDDPNAAASGQGRIQTGLKSLDYMRFDAHAPTATVSFGQPPRNIPDVTPNKFSPAVLDGINIPAKGPKSYSEAVIDDAKLHDRVGDARYGAAGAGAVSLIEGVASGSFNSRKVAFDIGLGAASAQTETLLARGTDRLLGRTAMPPNIAAGAIPGPDVNVGIALRPPSLAAGAGASGMIGGVVGGGLAAWHDANEVKSGRMTAGHATADVAVQAGIGVSAGVVAAGAGAAIGSVLPIAGTAVGAVAGFGVGTEGIWKLSDRQVREAFATGLARRLDRRRCNTIDGGGRCPDHRTGCHAWRTGGARCLRPAHRPVRWHRVRRRVDFDTSGTGRSFGAVASIKPAHVEADRGYWNRIATGSSAGSPGNAEPAASALSGQHVSPGHADATAERNYWGSVAAHAPAVQPATQPERPTANPRR